MLSDCNLFEIKSFPDERGELSILQEELVILLVIIQI